MSLTLVITAAGRAALLNAENTGTASVNIASIGISATVINATAATAVLPGEIKRIATIAGTLIAADQIHVTITDETVDVYTLRSLAVYLGDGTLFAAYGQPTPILEKSATALMLLALDITLLDAAAVAFTFGDAGFLNPQATTERVGVVELATPSETQAGLDTTRSVTPAGLLAAFATLLGQVWRASNDGAGSGLDADLLDGQQGSWYADIVSRLGYTPPNRAGDTFTGPIRRDGGFAIDFVGLWPAIGWEINDYDAYIRSVDQRLFVIAGTQVVTFGGDGVVNAIGGYRANGSLVWHAGNDGPGSGLDADLLDGYNSSDFDRVVASSLIAQGGYITYANGRKKCWGWIDLAANSAGTWFYPISFDSFAHPKCAAQAISGNNAQRDNIGIENLPGLSSITVRNAEDVALRMWIEMEGV